MFTGLEYEYASAEIHEASQCHSAYNGKNKDSEEDDRPIRIFVRTLQNRLRFWLKLQARSRKSRGILPASTTDSTSLTEHADSESEKVTSRCQLRLTGSSKIHDQNFTGGRPGMI